MRRLQVLPLALLACLAVSASSRSAHAATELIGGWEGDSFQQGYGFLAVGPLVRAGPDVSIPARLTGSYLYYDFISDGQTTKVRAPGLSGMTGLRLGGDAGSLTLLGGAEWRNERRELLGGSTPATTQGKWGGIAQVEGNLPLTQRWSAFLLGSYAGAARYLYGLGWLQAQLNNLEWRSGATTLFAGLEGVRQGNNESSGAQGGAFLSLSLGGSGVSLRLHGGYKETWSPGTAHRRGGYGGLGFYKSF